MDIGRFRFRRWPRWLKIASVAVGAPVIVAGGTLWAVREMRRLRKINDWNSTLDPSLPKTKEERNTVLEAKEGHVSLKKGLRKSF